MRRKQLVVSSVRQLHTAEDALEQTLVEFAKLAQMLGEGRMSTGLSAVVGQEAIDGLADVYKRLSKARGQAVGLHHVLKDACEQIGEGAVLGGPDGSKPVPPPSGRLIEVVDITKRDDTKAA